MRKHREFSTTGLESLEDRSVPSGFGFGFGGGQTPSVVAQDARQVQQAFSAFQSTYINDFRTVLYGADSTGTINPAANRATFDQDIQTALNTLNSTITTQAVSNLAATNPTLAATITSDLLGTTANTLQGQLQALTTPTGVFTTSSRTFQRSANAAINSFDHQVLQLVQSATPPTSTTTGGTTTPTLTQALPPVQQAFATFASAYINDVKTYLFGADSTGAINPANNRATFDQHVRSDLTTLDSSVATALTNASASSTLVSQVHTAIIGTDPNSLQTKLSKLTTPTGAYTPSSFLFAAESGIAIIATDRAVISDITTAAGGVTSIGNRHGHHRF